MKTKDLLKQIWDKVLGRKKILQNAIKSIMKNLNEYGKTTTRSEDNIHKKTVRRSSVRASTQG